MQLQDSKKSKLSLGEDIIDDRTSKPVQPEKKLVLGEDINDTAPSKSNVNPLLPKEKKLTLGEDIDSPADDTIDNPQPDYVRQKNKYSNDEERSKAIDEEINSLTNSLETKWNDFKKTQNATMSLEEREALAKTDPKYRPWSEQKGEVIQKLETLKKERRDLKDKMIPSTPELKEKVVKSFEFQRDSSGKMINNYIGVVGEIGENKYNRLDRETQNEAMDSLTKQNLDLSERTGNAEAFFSFDALKHYSKDIKKPEVDALVGVIAEAEKDPEYSGIGKWTGLYNYESKRKVMNAHIKRYVDEHFKELEPEARKKKYLEYAKTANAAMTVDPESGKLTVYGLKTYAESAMQQVKARYDEIADIRERLHEAEFPKTDKDGNPLMTITGRGPDSKYNYQNFEAYKQKIENEYQVLTGALEFATKVLKMPEQKRGIRDLAKGMGRDNMLVDLATLGIEEMNRTTKVAEIGKKLQGAGGYYEPTWGEQKLVEMYSVLQDAQGRGTVGGWSSIGGGITQMLPYIAGFAGTQVAYKGAQGLLRKGISTGTSAVLGNLKPVIAESLTVKPNLFFSKVLGSDAPVNFAKISADYASKFAAAGVQTVALPQYIKKNIAERSMPEMQTFVDKHLDVITAIDRNTQNSPFEAAFKGSADAYFEILSEHAGNKLMQAASMPLRMAKVARGIDVNKALFLQKFFDLKGYKSFDAGVKKITESGLGWHGIKEEYLEELANYGASHVTSGDSTKGFWHDQLITFGTVAMFGGPMKAIPYTAKQVRFARYGFVGDDVVYVRNAQPEKKNENGVVIQKEKKKGIVRIPQAFHEKLLEVFKAPGEFIDENKYADLISEWTSPSKNHGTLNKEQLDFVFNLSLQAGQEKAFRNIVIDHAKKNGYLAEEVAVNMTESERKSFSKMLSPEDIDKITKKNDSFRKKYSDLIDNDLMPQDDTGQFLQPTPEYLSSTREALLKDIESGNEKTQSGNYKNLGEEEKREIVQLRTIIDSLDESRDKARIDELQSKIESIEKTIPSSTLDSMMKLQVVEEHLDKMADDLGLRFNYRLPSEKNKIIRDELAEGKKLQGKADMITDKKMLITLPDGRQVHAYVGPKEGIGETQEEYRKRKLLIADQIHLKKAPVTLELVRKQDWNPDNKAGVITENPSTGEIENLPYGDKINVLVDGKFVASVEISDYNEKQLRARKYAEAKRLAQASIGEMVQQFINKTGGIAYFSEPEANKMIDALTDLVTSVATMMNIKISEAIENIKVFISEMKMSAEEKNYVNDLLLKHEDTIYKYIAQKKIADAGLGKQPKELNLKELVFDNNEGIATSAGQKVDMHLKTFFPLWKGISQIASRSKDDVETRFFEIANDGSIDGVTNDETFTNWIISKRGGDVLTNAIMDALAKMKFETAVSMFNFYQNVAIVKQVAVIIDKEGKIKIEQLNKSNSYNNILDRFRRHMERLDASKIYIKDKVLRYKKEHEDRFKGYKLLSAEDRIALKQQEFENDLFFLFEITGIDPETWREYFNKQNKETVSFAKIGDKQKTEFETIENLIANETYRLGSDGRHVDRFGEPWYWQQTDLVFNLLYGKNDPKKFTTSEYLDLFKKYFTEGDVSKKVFSNLYKLSASFSNERATGLSGRNVKDDRFSSFLQFSDFYTTAHDIQDSTVDNPLVRMYQQSGRKMEITVLNGMHNRKIDDTHKGKLSSEMSMEDLWVSLMNIYGKGIDGEYLHNIGQFSDKDAIYLVSAPKYDLNTENKSIAAELLGGIDVFNKIVEEIKFNVVALNQSAFSEYRQDTSDMEAFSEYNDFIEGFLINHVINSRDSQELFFGAFESYAKKGKEPKFVDMIKRAGSANSPGYRLNTNIEGGLRKTFTFAYINEQQLNLLDGNGNPYHVSESQNGQIWMRGKAFADKAQVSMGTIYSKKNEYPVLDSMKAIMSFKHRDTNKRELTKANILNVDVMAELFGGVYKDMKDFMDTHGIDIMSMPSSSKVHSGTEQIMLFDENGNVNKGIKIDKKEKEKYIETRETSTLYVQQDLRHHTVPKKTTMASQFLTNMFTLDNVAEIISYIGSMQQKGLARLSKSLKNGEISKLDYVRNHVNEFSQAELKTMLQRGLSIDDPGYRVLMHQILSTAISKNTLDVAVNRVATQEIADSMGILKPLRPTEDGKHTRLPEIITSVEGAREEKIFKGTMKQAIDFVSANYEEYQDLLDSMWELEDLGNGTISIPGEIVISTRVPADGLHSHTVARLKKNIVGHNFTMLDRISQEASGSDFDGDARFNQVFFKDKEGKAITDLNDQRGLANEIMMAVVKSYQDPKMFDFIINPINTAAYDDIVDKLRINTPLNGNRFDPFAYMQSRLNNMVGVKMKGIMTDHMTIFSLLNRYDIRVKNGLRIILNNPSNSENTIYSELGDKTQSENVVIDKNRWKTATEPIVKRNGVVKEVIATRINSSKYHFGNPFSHDAKIVAKNKTLTLTGSIHEAVERYIDWVINSKDERAAWIRGKLVTGELKGKQIIYYDELGEPSHATALDYLINKHDWSEDPDLSKTKISSISSVDVINLSGIAKDQFGAIKAHMSNLLNLCFDNAKDPKIEILGLNEITANMYVLSLIANSENSSVNFKNYREHHAAIKNAIEKSAAYFNSPVVRRYVYYKRLQAGGMRNDNDAAIKSKLIGEAKSGEYGFTDSDLKALLQLNQAAKELADIRTLYRLTQEGPETYADYIKARHVIRKVKNFGYDFKKDREKRLTGMSFLNTSPLFTYDKNKKITGFVPELAVVEDVIEFAKNNVFNDLIEESPAGKQIFAYLFGVLKDTNPELRELSTRNIAAFSGALNRIFNIRALNDRRTFKQVQTELFKVFPLLKGEYGEATAEKRQVLKDKYDKYADNQFIAYLKMYNKTKPDGKTPGVMVIGIQPEYTFARIPEEKMNQIRNDFDKLPEDVQNLFASYVAYQFGLSNISSNGGFFDLFSQKYRVALSNKMTEEKNKWLNDEISATEKLHTATWMRRILADNDMRSTSPDLTLQRIADYYTESQMRKPLPTDMLEAVDHIENLDTAKEEFASLLESYGVESITDWIKAMHPELPEGTKLSITIHARQAVQRYKNLVEEKAKKYFPDDSTNYAEKIRNMYAGDAAMEAMLSEDPAIEEKIYDHLRKVFPKLKIFTSRQAFHDYVKKNSDRTIKLDINAIGHAFKNAIYIDPTSEVQERLFHEMGHVYWDHLPADHPVKRKLRDLYTKLYNLADYDLDEIDEMIIIDMGRMGTEYATTYMSQNLFDRFVELMKEFWAAVKQFFGEYSKTDLLNEMVRSIYENRDNIDLSTAEGIATVRNLQLATPQSIGAVRNKDAHLLTLGNMNLPGITSVISRFEYTKFDPAETLQMSLDKFIRNFKKTTGQDPSPEMILDEEEGIKLKWEQDAMAGTNIHSVSEAVFMGKPFTDELKNNFATEKAFNEYVASMRKLKAEILQKWPNAKFFAEEDVISTKFKLFGIADLIVDIGDNKLIIFDFKTTDKEFLDKNGKETEMYNRNYGMMKAPLSNIRHSYKTKHTLQLSIEGVILEEQSDMLGTKEKNTIEGMYIVPVMREVDDKGLVTKARISNVVEIPGTDEARALDNCVKINYERDLALSLLTKFAESHKDLEKELPEYERKMRAAGVPAPIIKESLEAISYLTTVSGYDSLKDITFEAIQDVRNNGVPHRYRRFIDLGYDSNDYKTLPFEVFLHVTAGDGITKKDFVSNKGAYYGNEVVGTERKRILNPDLTEEERNRGWYHINIDGQDLYSHEAGTKNIKVGDKILEISRVKGAKKTHQSYIIGKVVEINKKYKWVKIIDEKTDLTHTIYQVQPTEGILLYDENPHHPGRKTTPNNYIERYVTVEDPIIEEHWKYKAPESPEIAASKAKVWSFFSTYNTRDDMMKLVSDYDEMKEIYHSMSDDPVTVELKKFLQEMLVNHYMAQQIRIEHSFEANGIMPMTLNTYYMMTRPEKALFDLNGWWGGAYFWQPSRMFSSEYVGANMLMYGIENSLRRAAEEQHTLRIKLEKYINLAQNPSHTDSKGVRNSDKFDIDNVMSRMRGERYWMIPNRKKHTKEEFDFLNLIYKHYYTYVHKYSVAKKQAEEKGETNYPQLIPVTRVFATIEEVKNNPLVGRKWGDIVYEMTAPSMYDNTYVELLEKRNGRMVKSGKFAKFGDLKQQFVYDSGFAENPNPKAQKPTDDEKKAARKEWLGNSRKAHMFRHIPVLRSKTKLVPGTLYHYYNEAKKNFTTGKGEGNKKPQEKQRRITTMHSLNVIYQTKHLMEAEEKAMESNVFAYFMKGVVAPIDYIKAMYATSPKAEKYIGEFVDFVIFKKGKDLGAEWTGMIDFMTKTNSLAKIAWAPKTTMYNFVIGQSMDLVREPRAYFKGIGRYMANSRKVINVIRKYGVGTVIDETQFDDLAKAAGINFRWGDKNYTTFTIEDAAAMGYVLMDVVEKMNQIPVFVGLMTDEEWNSYNDNGDIKDPSKYTHLSPFRRQRLSDAIKDIHGDYRPENAAPFWNTNFGRSIAQFKKFLPATFWAEFAPYHFDRDYLVRSGIVPTALLLSRIAIFNTTSAAMKAKKFERIITETWPDIEKARNSGVDKITIRQMIERKKTGNDRQRFILNGLSDYLDMLIAERNAGRIQWADLSENDKKNLWSLFAQIAIGVLVWTRLAAIKGQGDDEKKFYQTASSNLYKFLMRYNQDMFMYLQPNSAVQMTENMGVAWLDVLINGTKSLVHAEQYLHGMYSNFMEAEKEMGFKEALDYGFWSDEGVFQKDGVLKEGSPMFLKDALAYIPAGGFAKSAISTKRWAEDKRTVENFMKKQGYEQKYIDATVRSIDEVTRVKDFISNGEKYRAYMSAMEKAEKWRAYEAKGVSREVRDIDNYQKDVNKHFDDVYAYAGYQKLVEEAIKDPEKIQKIFDDAKKYDAFFAKGKHLPMDKTQKRFNKAINDLKEPQPSETNDNTFKLFKTK